MLLEKKYEIKSDSELEFMLESMLDEAKTESGGYGFPIRVREYNPNYGPVATSRTTYYALLGKEIFR
jgi:hypothetical protein